MSERMSEDGISVADELGPAFQQKSGPYAQFHRFYGEGVTTEKVIKFSLCELCDAVSVIHQVSASGDVTEKAIRIELPWGIGQIETSPEEWDSFVKILHEDRQERMRRFSE